MKKGDLIIIILALLSIMITVLFMKLSNTNYSSKYALVKVKKKEIMKIPLNNDSSSILEFEFEKGVGYIEYDKGRVRILEMDKRICPKKVCSLTGWIDRNYESIVCLPNQITVSIEYVKNINYLDEISY